MYRITLALLGLVFAHGLRGAESPDPSLLNGLKAYETNGANAATLVWYADRPAVATEMKDLLIAATKNLGEVIDTEVVAIQPVSKRVTRYYVAVYFTRCPIWVRIERYVGRDRSFYLPLKVSTNLTSSCRDISRNFSSSRKSARSVRMAA